MDGSQTERKATRKRVFTSIGSGAVRNPLGLSAIIKYDGDKCNESHSDNSGNRTHRSIRSSQFIELNDVNRSPDDDEQDSGTYDRMASSDFASPKPREPSSTARYQYVNSDPSRSQKSFDNGDTTPVPISRALMAGSFGSSTPQRLPPRHSGQHSLSTPKPALQSTVEAIRNGMSPTKSPKQEMMALLVATMMKDRTTNHTHHRNESNSGERSVYKSLPRPRSRSSPVLHTAVCEPHISVFTPTPPAAAARAGGINVALFDTPHQTPSKDDQAISIGRPLFPTAPAENGRHLTVSVARRPNRNPFLQSAYSKNRRDRLLEEHYHHASVSTQRSENSDEQRNRGHQRSQSWSGGVTHPHHRGIELEAIIAHEQQPHVQPSVQPLNYHQQEHRPSHGHEEKSKSVKADTLSTGRRLFESLSPEPEPLLAEQKRDEAASSPSVNFLKPSPSLVTPQRKHAEFILRTPGHSSERRPCIDGGHTCVKGGAWMRTPSPKDEHLTFAPLVMEGVTPTKQYYDAASDNEVSCRRTSHPPATATGGVSSHTHYTGPLPGDRAADWPRFSFRHIIPWLPVSANAPGEYVPLHQDCNGTVWLATGFVDGMPYAVKEVPIADDTTDDEARAQIEIEISCLVLSAVTRHITRYFTAAHDERRRCFVLQTEYCSRGTLLEAALCHREEWVNTAEEGFEEPVSQSVFSLPTEDELWAVCSQVYDGLAVLHRHGYCHGALSPCNVLMDDDGQACLTNFGAARVTTVPPSVASTFHLGRRSHSSPTEDFSVPAIYGVTVQDEPASGMNGRRSAPVVPQSSTVPAALPVLYEPFTDPSKHHISPGITGSTSRYTYVYDEEETLQSRDVYSFAAGLVHLLRQCAWQVSHQAPMRIPVEVEAGIQHVESAVGTRDIRVDPPTSLSVFLTEVCRYSETFADFLVHKCMSSANSRASASEIVDCIQQLDVERYTARQQNNDTCGALPSRVMDVLSTYLEHDRQNFQTIKESQQEGRDAAYAPPPSLIGADSITGELLRSYTREQQRLRVLISSVQDHLRQQSNGIALNPADLLTGSHSAVLSPPCGPLSSTYVPVLHGAVQNPAAPEARTTPGSLDPSSPSTGLRSDVIDSRMSLRCGEDSPPARRPLFPINERRRTSVISSASASSDSMAVARSLSSASVSPTAYQGKPQPLPIRSQAIPRSVTTPLATFASFSSFAPLSSGNFVGDFPSLGSVYETPTDTHNGQGPLARLSKGFHKKNRPQPLAVTLSRGGSPMPSGPVPIGSFAGLTTPIGEDIHLPPSMQTSRGGSPVPSKTLVSYLSQHSSSGFQTSHTGRPAHQQNRPPSPRPMPLGVSVSLTSAGRQSPLELSETPVFMPCPPLPLSRRESVRLPHRQLQSSPPGFLQPPLPHVHSVSNQFDDECLGSIANCSIAGASAIPQQQSVTAHLRKAISTHDVRSPPKDPQLRSLSVSPTPTGFRPLQLRKAQSYYSFADDDGDVQPQLRHSEDSSNCNNHSIGSSDAASEPARREAMATLTANADDVAATMRRRMPHVKRSNAPLTADF